MSIRHNLIGAACGSSCSDVSNDHDKDNDFMWNTVHLLRPFELSVQSKHHSPIAQASAANPKSNNVAFSRNTIRKLIRRVGKQQKQCARQTEQRNFPEKHFLLFATMALTTQKSMMFIETETADSAPSEKHSTKFLEKYEVLPTGGTM